ncbi:Tigger transposable element-derived protein 7-like 17, partial [Homarus americanus]
IKLCTSGTSRNMHQASIYMAWTFNTSAGWLFNFRSRHCLVNRKVVGEFASADKGSVEPFRKHLLLVSQIYNADETDLFWKAPPSNTQAYRHETHVAGRKMAKDRVSILVCANADGTHRLKMMVVGKANKLHALKKYHEHLTSDILYKGNKTGWFTRDIFHTWFHSHYVPVVIKYQVEVLGISRDNNRLLKGTEVEVDLAGFGTDDFVNLLHRGGETGVSEDNVDNTEQGFCHDTEKEIIASVSEEMTEEQIDECDDEDPSPRPKLSNLRFHLDKALEVVGQLPGLEKHCSTLRDIRADVIKCQHTNFKQGKIPDFFKPASRVPRTSRPSSSSEASSVIPSVSGYSSSDTSSSASFLHNIFPEAPHVILSSD